LTALREFDGHQQGVDDPTEDRFACGPTSVSFEQLLDRRWLVPVGIVAGLEAAKDFVKGMEQDATLIAELSGSALPHADEVVNKDVRGLEAASPPLPVWWINRDRGGLE
jgi:hypothetical protein